MDTYRCPESLTGRLRKYLLELCPLLVTRCLCGGYFFFLWCLIWWKSITITHFCGVIFKQAFTWGHNVLHSQFLSYVSTLKLKSGMCQNSMSVEACQDFYLSICFLEYRQTSTTCDVHAVSRLGSQHEHRMWKLVCYITQFKPKKISGIKLLF